MHRPCSDAKAWCVFYLPDRVQPNSKLYTDFPKRGTIPVPKHSTWGRLPPPASILNPTSRSRIQSEQLEVMFVWAKHCPRTGE
ncbi:hypothetical protein CDAR_304521 [Caerostris darwini]|uniref:Uncharacterized protein n=1 Tax=Caerostris darwini TaxID=1538125 RepID=A0AAV4NJF7_9ARAC|nr:hypothetical protein CDAR_304521 [Caerostris darwini]